MSLSPSMMGTGSFDGYFLDASENRSPLTITTNWVRGTSNVSVEAFSAGNPLLGRAGWAMIRVGAASVADSTSPFSQSFLSADSRSNGLRIDTRNLEIPDGSESGALTIRAVAF